MFPYLSTCKTINPQFIPTQPYERCFHSPTAKAILTDMPRNMIFPTRQADLRFFHSYRTGIHNEQLLILMKNWSSRYNRAEDICIEVIFETRVKRIGSHLLALEAQFSLSSKGVDMLFLTINEWCRSVERKWEQRVSCIFKSVEE